ncbi:MAG: hypothetical protein ACYCVL_07140 [Gemmatimonadaceae bacterium]
MADRDPDEPSPSMGRVPDSPGLDDLRAQFDAVFETMQGPEPRAAVDRALGAIGAETGPAAVEAARGAGRPSLMRHRIRLVVEVPTTPDLAAHFRDRASRVPDDPELSAALIAAAEGLERQQPPGQIASELERKAAEAGDYCASALRGVAEALRRIAYPIVGP